MKATKVNAGLAESNGRLLLGIWRDSLHVTCGLTACTPGSSPGPTLGNEYGKTLPFLRACERINFELAVLVYRAQYGTAPRYLAEELCYVADMPVGERSSPIVDLQSAGCPTITPRYC